MKILLILVVILMPGICIANSQSKVTRARHDAKAERELRKLERAWLDAGHNKNVEAMQRILANDFIITFKDGSTRDKAEVIRRLRIAAVNPNESDWTEDSRVQVYRDTAIITGK